MLKEYTTTPEIYEQWTFDTWRDWKLSEDPNATNDDETYEDMPPLMADKSPEDDSFFGASTP